MHVSALVPHPYLHTCLCHISTYTERKPSPAQQHEAPTMPTGAAVSSHDHAGRMADKKAFLAGMTKGVLVGMERKSFWGRAVCTAQPSRNKAFKGYGAKAFNGQSLDGRPNASQ